MKSSSESTSPNAAWCGRADAVAARAGRTRMRAICADTFAAGSMPPIPGLAPWLSLISMARTGAEPRSRGTDRWRSVRPRRGIRSSRCRSARRDRRRAVVVRDAALSRVLQGAGELHPAVDGLDGPRAERAEAHRRGVDDRRRAGTRVLRPREAPSTLADGQACSGRSRLALVRRWQRERGVADHDVARGLLEVVVGAEAEVVVLPLRRRVNPAPLVAGEGPLVVVAGDDVLAERSGPNDSSK